MLGEYPYHDPSSIVKFEEGLKRMLSFAGIMNYALVAYDESR